MSDSIIIPADESLAAVKWQGQWRFFYDIDIMFLLDYRKYDPKYRPKTDSFRLGTLIVDETNIDLWMHSMSGELSTEQIPYARWADDTQVQLTFVINFDVRLWVGYLWQNDQSAYQEYQPDGWTAIEDDVFAYLPKEFVHLWDSQLIQNPVIALIDGWALPMIRRGSRAGTFGTVRYFNREAKEVHFEIKQGDMSDGSITNLKTIYRRNHYLDVGHVKIYYEIEPNHDVNLRMELLQQNSSIQIQHIDTIVIRHLT